MWVVGLRNPGGRGDLQAGAAAPSLHRGALGGQFGTSPTTCWWRSMPSGRPSSSPRREDETESAIRTWDSIADVDQQSEQPAE